ncbi:hypothetical protein V7793_34710, partial [Streptomyces sp. KLMMK]|uniref:hypothetical protein n=1 Tax=Streptomyces sp. KLMMK TaxID=3109353 RepID=UPI003009B0D3
RPAADSRNGPIDEGTTMVKPGTTATLEARYQNSSGRAAGYLPRFVGGRRLPVLPLRCGLPPLEHADDGAPVFVNGRIATAK